MPRVRYTADGGHYRVGGHGFDHGDERDVDDDLAGYLADHEDFEVLAAGDDAVREEDGPPDDAPDFDPGDTTDFGGNGWLELDYQTRAEIVEAGNVDEWLDAIADAETSQTVTDAVEERRDELEG